MAVLAGAAGLHHVPDQPYSGASPLCLGLQARGDQSTDTDLVHWSNIRLPQFPSLAPHLGAASDTLYQAQFTEAYYKDIVDAHDLCSFSGELSHLVPF